MLLTALAATAVLLPLSVTGLPGGRDDSPPAAEQTILAEQPLTDLSAGETVREISQPTPFSLVALTADDLTGTTARLRAKRDDGSWGPWYDAEPMEAEGPEDGTGPRGTQPVFVGRTTTVQIAISRPAPANVPPATDNAPKPDLGYVPASVEQPFGQNVNAVLISPPPQAPGDVFTPPTAVSAPGQPPHVIPRAEWGADESMRCGAPRYDDGIKAGVVHHTAGSNDYSPEDSAAIVRAIYAYHTRTLGWCDIAYNALVDKYGQVFEGRAGGINAPVEGSHTGGFNLNTWGVAMMGNFNDVPPTPIQMRNTARLLGWRLLSSGVDPRGMVSLTSSGGSFTKFSRGSVEQLPAIFTHRDVGVTDCPGNAAYAAMDQIRDMAARFNDPPGPRDLADVLRGGAIFDRWQRTGGPEGFLGAPRTLESSGAGDTKYVRFDHGAVYWSPKTGANPVTGALYDAWASLGYERGLLGLPTSGEIAEPQWIVQNFQHGTLNFDRQHLTITRVADGVAVELPPVPASGPPVQLERFTPITP